MSLVPATRTSPHEGTPQVPSSRPGEVHGRPESRPTKDPTVNPYLGEPHEVLARIHHEELLAQAERARLLRELRRQTWTDGGRPAQRVLRRARALLASHTYERSHAPHLAR